jgi:GNAT superfamily N-acetyltransferase
MNNDKISYGKVNQSDFEDLLHIRILCMKESLEAIGRFDLNRARERLMNSFEADRAKYIYVNNEKVGFYSLSESDAEIKIEHLYVRPEFQNMGIGRKVIDEIKSQARNARKNIILFALIMSKSNEFYKANQFVCIRNDEWDNLYEWKRDAHGS